MAANHCKTMNEIKTDTPVQQAAISTNPIIKQILGLIGSCFLIVAVFLPYVKLVPKIYDPFEETWEYQEEDIWNPGSYFTGDGKIVMILGLLFPFSSVVQKNTTGFMSPGLLAF